MVEVKHDGVFDLAVGRSRKETHWVNCEMRWSDFVDRVSKTNRTSETYTEYLAAKRDRQAEIKDVGGFVGGYVNGGRRKAENITHRQLVTLDIDYPMGGEWEQYLMLYGNAAAIYSTHKHSPEKPRLRFVAPLDRPVGMDEYVAIARRLAMVMGIDSFDDTTYAPERLMYWPSTAADGEYVFHHHDGEWLSADELLSSYENWKDTSEWPLSSREGEIVFREIKKQGDPLEKQGLIGAFCRAYDIHAVILEYLSDVYTPCAVDGRYTYAEGSTAAGLVVYDDVYAYSHHATDPTSGRLCNAFDLVRLHKFADRDENAKEGTPANKLPSFLAMSDLVGADKNVKRVINRERAENIAADFGDLEIDGEPANNEWADDLDLDRKGVLRGTIANYEMILRRDSSLRGAFRYNEFKNVMEICSRLPWRKKGDLSQWKDADDAALRSYIEGHYKTLSRSNLADAVVTVFEENRYHPVRDYLKKLKWDGVPRIETLFADYLGAPDHAYVREISRKALTAAVARVFQPGTKFDNVVVLVGEQGVGKSTLLKKLGGAWFSDNFHAVQGKDAIEQIQGVWIMEIGELAGLKKAEVEAIKSYISTVEDRCRLAYARRVESFPRQCVFFGTTNNRNFLNDPTGNRRFWPVEIGETAPRKNLFLELDSPEIDQIWAEAVVLYEKGEPLYLGKELEQYARTMQSQHSEQDERIGIVQEYLDTPLPDNWASMKDYERRNYFNDPVSPQSGTPRNRVCAIEIWCECFGKNKADMDRKATMEIKNIMRQMEGWKEVKAIRIAGYDRQRGYVRVDKS